MSKHILVVEDNPLNATLMLHLLESHGYSAVAAGDSVEAFQSIAQRPPALILLDLQLPGMDGFEIATRLRADPDTARVPIVAVTGYSAPEDRERAFAAGCDNFVTKPIDFREIIQLVGRHLA